MAWIVPSENDLGERLAAAELTALQNAATGAHGNTVPDIMTSVVAEVRGRVAANKQNLLGAAGTIPEELRGAALAIARWRALSRLPGLRSLQDDARRMEYTDALALLASVARGEFAIEQPEDAADIDTAGIPDPSVGDPRSEFERGNTVL